MTDFDTCSMSLTPILQDPGRVPVLFRDAGEQAWRKFIEFFTARIRNRNTRDAYARVVRQFSEWCVAHRLTLHQLNPFFVAAYIEDLGAAYSRPTVKQHLAAVRMLFDFLVVSQILPSNPAASVRGPKHIVKKGKTSVLTAEEARCLLDSIPPDTLAGLRDRALIATMVYSFARVGAVVAMDVEDYYQQCKRMWFRLHEKGGKRHDVPAHHKAEDYMDLYVTAAGSIRSKGAPSFARSTAGGS
jgi:integrase/recombinase XerD